MPLNPGTRLGPYEIIELAGEGGMGDVYRARDTRLRRTVAIKVASHPMSEAPHLRARFQQEARAIAALNHAHICGIHDVATFDGNDVIVMEYLDGETLEQRLRRGPLATAELLSIAIPIADALGAAHREGIIHRDLKPSNVMVTRSGVKLLDFGIAKQREIGRDPTSSVDATGTVLRTVEGTLVGTVPYMAPEQLEGKPADARTDIFAFGAVLFEMATGKPAFSGASTAALVAAILAESRPVAAATEPNVPRVLDRIISACLARDPDSRIQHAADLLRELRWAQDDLTDPASVTGVPRVSTRWRVHASWAALLATSVIAVWLLSRPDRDGLPPPNRVPVIVLMDSPLPGRVYDSRTREEGNTNADDVTDVLRNLPVLLDIRKENTSAVWHREEQVVGQNPDLVVSHLSCLLDERVGEGQPAVADHLFDLAENRLLVFLAYVASRNPRTRFIVYSRTTFQTHGGEDQWVAKQVARWPVLRDRLNAFIVPGGREKASFRQPETAQLLRARVTQVLGLASQ